MLKSLESQRKNQCFAPYPIQESNVSDRLYIYCSRISCIQRQ
jgi:hypothetical protein